MTEFKTFRAEKSYRAEVKSSDSGTGIVEAIVSVFGNVDYGGDRVEAGAFTASLAEWAASGDPIPFIWSHDWKNPDAHIGYVLEAYETEKGLYIKAQLDVGKPFADQVLHLLKERRVKEFSFGYEVLDAKKVSDPDGAKRSLIELGVLEVGPCLMGMNPDTELLGAASRDSETKAGLPAEVKTIIGTHEALRERVRDALRKEYGPRWPYIRGLFATSVVFDVYEYDEAISDWRYLSIQRSFSDDGTTVTLADDAVEVSVMEVVLPVADADTGEKAATGDSHPNISNATDERKSRLLDLLTQTKNEKGSTR